MHQQDPRCVSCTRRRFDRRQLLQLGGGGVRGGAVYGSSDKQGAYVASGRPISHIDFGATLFHALGIPPETRYGPDGFSLRVSEGEPVLELFG